VKVLTGGEEQYATSPRAYVAESVRIRYRRYSPDERNNVDGDGSPMCEFALKNSRLFYFLTDFVFH
jgi:hypothetical protein